MSRTRSFVAAIAVSGALAAVGPLAGGCSGGTSSTGGAGGPNGEGDAAAGPLPGSDGSVPGTGSVDGSGGGGSHTPATGCREGFTACTATAPGVCAHLDDDFDHCGTCGTPCQGGSCVAGACAPTSQVCPFGAMCGGECIRDRHKNVDQCGSCFNRCASGSLCLGGACVAPEGNGSSCASPLLWDVEAEENAGFRLDFDVQSTFVHPCGPLSPIPTKWFRFTAPKDSTNVSVRPSVSTDKLVITLFSSSACNSGVVVGCSAKTPAPFLDVPGTEGTTYFVGVGAVSVTAGTAASMKVDH